MIMIQNDVVCVLSENNFHFAQFLSSQLEIIHAIQYPQPNACTDVDHLRVAAALELDLSSIPF
jgi:hypothetical protein